MRRALVIAFVLFGLPVQAQEDDRDYLTAFLEDTLSGAGRKVTVTGFAGALSSQATIEQLTIADDQGIWITLNGVVLDWSRSALLSGEVVVNELSADEIIVTRAPVATPEAMPAPEAAGFSLPDLPVSIDIEKVAADRIELGPDLLGQPVTGTLSASLELSGGEGQAVLDLIRTGDGPAGEIRLDAAYSNATRALKLSLRAEEAAGGIAASLLGLPGNPSARLQIAGEGPIDDFAADIALATDGADRLSGTVTLRAEDGGQRFGADLAGDLAPILAPEMVDFFGNEIALKLDAWRSGGGRVVLDRLDLSARSLSLTGAGEIAADGVPERLTLSGRLAAPDGAPVVLPLAEDTRVTRADFALNATQRDDDSWSGSLSVQGLDRPDLKIADLAVKGSGRIGRSAAGRSFGGTLNGTVSGLAPADPALAEALGTALAASLRFHSQEGSGALRLTDIRLEGAGLTGTGALRIEGLEQALMMTGRLALEVGDLARFSRLAGRPLGGAGRLELAGSASRLSGVVDGEIGFDGTGLSIGQAEVDRLLSGASRLTASVRRDETGTVLRSLDLVAGGLQASASGRLASAGSDVSGTVSLADLAVLGAGYGGAVMLDGRFSGTPEAGAITLKGEGRALRIGTPEADRLLAGQSTLDLDLGLNSGVVQVRSARLQNPQLTASATGEINGDLRRITLDARLANLGLIVPEVSGPLTVAGTAVQDAAGYRLDLRGNGPGQIAARVEGRVANDFRTADLAINGSGEAGLANLFLSPRSVSGRVGYDLRLAGPLAIGSLSGRVTLSDGRIADPELGLALQQVQAIGQLAGGTVQLSATSGLSTGGRLRVDGPVRLDGRQEADLSIALDNLRLYDPELYETRVSGSLALRGPLAGGALLSGTLQLGETEVRVPASGFGSAEALMNIRHVRDTAPVRETRRKAGLLAAIAAASRDTVPSRAIGLDLTINAPARVFVRGRGIDAELGGSLRLLGTTAEVRPAGGFSLIRGRIDILGRRLVLTRADLVMEGSLVPQISIAADSQSEGIVSTVTVEGPANDPEVRFTSSPDLPQEEVLARLLFGRGLDNISALQAAQLANAVAVLAGRSGVGLVGNLRRTFGLDDLDVTTAEDGSAAVRAGKYISDNVYTEVEVDQEGKSRINLNLDLRRGLTVKGRLGADGETGIGIYLQRDY
ncbi:translocation/assembly module TamB domain-containing protein [Rhodobacter calidifons]|uniref:Translocation and assembly module protein TamB n=1 Tax=Rhodobacter calidifons TaxID=2715277 RepID=A0ABX0G515_9RHOB|nr:translocation/assembly module TamB domain-containing protein [Rhodobacter calidifons]NHB75963.1 translocation and assembly module protein TamB [Rhodobacter calidifons]